MDYTAYLGTDSVRGSQGIYTVALDGETGQLRLLAAAPAQDAGYLALSPDGRTLYAAIESMIYQGKAAGGVAAYHLDEAGIPHLLGTRAAAGQLTCHISCDEHRLYAASYLAGLATIYPLQADGSPGEPERVIRHEKTDGMAPHIHCVQKTADGNYLCCVEVGYHALVLYDAQSFEKVFETRLPPVRPRQIAVSTSHVYLLTEGGMSVEVYGYHPDSEEKLQHQQSILAVPEQHGMGGAGGIRLSSDGAFLFTSVRGIDVLAMFAVDPESGLLTLLDMVHTDGSTPRDFAVSPDDRYLLAGMQKSDTVSVYQIDKTAGRLTAVCTGFPVPSVSGVVFLNRGGAV